MIARAHDRRGRSRSRSSSVTASGAQQLADAQSRREAIRLFRIGQEFFSGREVRSRRRGVHQSDRQGSALHAGPLPGRAVLHEPEALRQRDPGVQASASSRRRALYGLPRPTASPSRSSATTRSARCARAIIHAAAMAGRIRGAVSGCWRRAPSSTCAISRASARRWPAVSGRRRKSLLSLGSAYFRNGDATPPRPSGRRPSRSIRSSAKRTTTSPSSTCRPAGSSTARGRDQGGREGRLPREPAAQRGSQEGARQVVPLSGALRSGLSWTDTRGGWLDMTRRNRTAAAAAAWMLALRACAARARAGIHRTRRRHDRGCHRRAAARRHRRRQPVPTDADAGHRRPRAGPLPEPAGRHLHRQG